MGKPKEETTDVEAFSDKNQMEMSESDKPKEKYPKVVFLIILNEFCERFSFYGLRTILYIYFTKFIMLQKDTATAIYHAYTTLCYFTPILGAIIADGYIGLYWTIISLSCAYFIGELIVTLTSIVPLGAPNVYGPVIGLLIIAIGTGGIKPCVGAFGGNQFKPTQKRYLENFFSIFYLSINIGSTIGTILTPIFRSDVKCFKNDCYPLAFGVPAIFMFVSVIVFIAGTKFYTRSPVNKGRNVITATLGCMYSAMVNKFKNGKTVKKDHWLDHASESGYEQSLISDVKAFARVFFVFLPLPIFWALYDQQGSRWTDQAQQLDGRIGSWTIKPDQFQAINPIFIVALVPVFDFVIYPAFAKFGFLKKQLQRMFVGLILAVAAFAIAAILESQMQKSSLALNQPKQIKFANLAPCELNFNYKLDENAQSLKLEASKYLKNKAIKLPKEVFSYVDSKKSLDFEVRYSCFQGSSGISNFRITNEDLPKTVLFYWENDQLRSTSFSYDITKPPIGVSEMKFARVVSAASLGDFEPQLSATGIVYDKFEVQQVETQKSVKYEDVDYLKYTLKVFPKGTNASLLLEAKDIALETSARYTILLFKNVENNKLDFVLLTDIYQNGVHIGWQLIQIFVMTLGEIMFSISGVSFAYSQAPASMKSVLQATWFLTVAFGNLIVVIVAEARVISDQVYEYVFFAGLLAVATVIFILLSLSYKYVEDEKKLDEEEKPEENKNEKKRKNTVSPLPSSTPRIELQNEEKF